MSWRIRGAESEGDFDEEGQALARAWYLADHAVPRQMQRAEVYEWVPPRKPDAPRGSAFRRPGAGPLYVPVVEPWQADLAARMGVHPGVLADAYLPEPKKVVAEKVYARMVVDRDLMVRDGHGAEVVRDRLVHMIQRELDKRGWQACTELEFDTEDDLRTYELRAYAWCWAVPRPEPRLKGEWGMD